jgi:hypothetical protein
VSQALNRVSGLIFNRSNYPMGYQILLKASPLRARSKFDCRISGFPLCTHYFRSKNQLGFSEQGGQDANRIDGVLRTNCFGTAPKWLEK